MASLYHLTFVTSAIGSPQYFSCRSLNESPDLRNSLNYLPFPVIFFVSRGRTRNFTAGTPTRPRCSRQGMFLDFFLNDSFELDEEFDFLLLFCANLTGLETGSWFFIELKGYQHRTMGLHVGRQPAARSSSDDLCLDYCCFCSEREESEMVEEKSNGLQIPYSTSGDPSQDEVKHPMKENEILLHRQLMWGLADQIWYKFYWGELKHLYPSTLNPICAFPISTTWYRK